jgi:hypothetical protein
MEEGFEVSTSLRPGEVISGMEELGIHAVAHVVIEGCHEYNLTRKQLEGMRGEMTVLKWGRESLGSPKAKRVMKKGALYQLRK